MFTIANIIGGLLQVWVLYIALSSLGKPHTLPLLLGDGGLFFFATSLTVNSVLVLLAESPARPLPWDLSITLFTILGTLVPSIVVYTAVLTNNPNVVAPFQDHTPSQISVAILAMAYALFVGVRTGYFNK